MSKSVIVPPPVPEVPASNALARRKTPQQQRALGTVDSILQATEELVRARGFGNVGTRLIAERAGVSVGSLYQYFPTYEAILLAWYEALAARVAHQMKLTMLAVAHEELAVSVPRAMKALLDAYEEHALVLVRMLDEVPDIEKATRGATFEELIRSSMRMYFSQHHAFKPKDTERHIFFLETIIFGSIRRYLKGAPSGVSKKSFLGHLSRLVIAYLSGDLGA